MRNKYIKKAKISEAEFRQILKLFCLEMEAGKIAEFMGITVLLSIGFWVKSGSELRRFARK